MRVLVTGANGFLGAHVCRALQRGGHAPVAAARGTSDLWRLDGLAAGVEKVTIDITDSASVDEALDHAGPLDGVVNCAGYGVNYNEQDAATAYSVNMAGAMTMALASHMRGLRFIQIGTSYEYGEWSDDISEDFPLKPSGIYGKTKAAASLSLTALAGSTGADISILRMFSMYGPLEGGHKLIPGVLDADANGRRMEMTPGEQVRDYLYVGDAAQAVCKSLLRTQVQPGEILNVCSGREVTLKAIVTAAVTGSQSIVWGARPYRPGEMMRVVGNPALAEQTLDWTAATGLEAGMAETKEFEALRPVGK